MAGIADSMADVFDYVWNRFQGRLAGLADDEYFWEPVCGCWSVRQAAGGVWVIDGAGGDVSAGPPPEFIQHAAEVGLLRDLYPHRADLGGG